MGLCVENASVDQLSFAINKIFLTGFDEKVLHRIMSIISERLVLPIIKSQDSEATNLTNFNKITPLISLLLLFILMRMFSEEYKLHLL